MSSKTNTSSSPDEPPLSQLSSTSASKVPVVHEHVGWTDNHDFVNKYLLFKQPDGTIAVRKVIGYIPPDHQYVSGPMAGQPVYKENEDGIFNIAENEQWEDAQISLCELNKCSAVLPDITSIMNNDYPILTMSKHIQLNKFNSVANVVVDVKDIEDDEILTTIHKQTWINLLGMPNDGLIEFIDPIEASILSSFFGFFSEYENLGLADDTLEWEIDRFANATTPEFDENDNVIVKMIDISKLNRRKYNSIKPYIGVLNEIFEVTEDYIRDNIVKKNYILIAYHDGPETNSKVIGLILFQTPPITNTSSKITRFAVSSGDDIIKEEHQPTLVEYLYTDKDFLRRGIGTNLLQFAGAWHRFAGNAYTYLALMVANSNEKGKKFYSKRGFKELTWDQHPSWIQQNDDTTKTTLVVKRGFIPSRQIGNGEGGGEDSPYHQILAAKESVSDNADDGIPELPNNVSTESEEMEGGESEESEEELSELSSEEEKNSANDSELSKKKTKKKRAKKAAAKTKKNSGGNTKKDSGGSKKKSTKKRANSKGGGDSMEDSEEEAPPTKKKARTTTAAKKKTKSKKYDDDSDDMDFESEEEPPPKKRATKKKAPAKKKASRRNYDDSDLEEINDSEEDESPAPKARGKKKAAGSASGRGRRNVQYLDSDSDDDDSQPLPRSGIVLEQQGEDTDVYGPTTSHSLLILLDGYVEVEETIGEDQKYTKKLYDHHTGFTTRDYSIGVGSKWKVRNLGPSRARLLHVTR